jgi:hypothetical protein
MQNHMKADPQVSSTCMMQNHLKADRHSLASDTNHLAADHHVIGI